MATPTHESWAASKRILAWLSHRADLGVTYGASHLTSAADLTPPKDSLLPMGDVRDFSHDFYALTLAEHSVSSGGVTQPCSCVNSGGCL
jgi:hypothetical protein